MKRKEFLKTSAAFTLGGLMIPDFLKAEKIKDIGVQLYTLRDNVDKDVLATLEAVSKLGYSLVEGYYVEKGHFYGYKPLEFKKILSDMGLKMPSTHVLTGRAQPEIKSSMANNWEKIVEEMNVYGIKYIVCPWIHADERKSIDDYKKLAEFLNKKAELSMKTGIKLAYHAHDFEYMPLEGQTPYEVLLKECDPKLVDFELDLYWVKKGGKDALTYIQNNPGRFPLWHVKDMDKEKSFFTEVGNGVIDFKTIFKQATKAGLKYAYVEQDICPGPPLDSVKISYNYLKSMNY